MEPCSAMRDAADSRCAGRLKLTRGHWKRCGTRQWTYRELVWLRTVAYLPLELLLSHQRVLLGPQHTALLLASVCAGLWYGACLHLHVCAYLNWQKGRRRSQHAARRYIYARAHYYSSTCATSGASGLWPAAGRHPVGPLCGPHGRASPFLKGGLRPPAAASFLIHQEGQVLYVGSREDRQLTAHSVVSAQPQPSAVCRQSIVFKGASSSFTGAKF
eukprot:scaffold28768_cov130-Isochrysis_galbana.AAC.2